jgi:hypothetical protein
MSHMTSTLMPNCSHLPSNPLGHISAGYGTWTSRASESPDNYSQNSGSQHLDLEICTPAALNQERSPTKKNFVSAFVTFQGGSGWDHDPTGARSGPRYGVLQCLKPKPRLPLAVSLLLPFHCNLLGADVLCLSLLSPHLSIQAHRCICGKHGCYQLRVFS